MFLGYADEDGKGWTDRDREMAKALHLFKHGQCPGCGFPKSEVWVDESDKAFEYIPEEVQCQACAPLQAEQAGTKTEKGLHYYLVRRPLGSKRPDHPERDVVEN